MPIFSMYRGSKCKKELSKSWFGVDTARNAVIGCALLSGAVPANADLNFTETLDPTTLVNQVISPAQTGIVVNSVTVFGGNGQIATFTNGLSIPGFIDFEEGIILSSGQVSSLTGPNTADGTGTDEAAIPGADGDPQFDALTSAPQGTFDAAYIEIDFTPSQDMIRGSFVFASDEYNEYAPPAGTSSAGNTYYDVMAFFVNGVNYSITASGENVSINTVNETLNAADFISNDLQDDGNPTPVNIAPDGFTRKLTWTAAVTPGVSNTLKFGVADGGDATFNSWLLVDKYAFEVAPAPTNVDLTLDKTDNTTAIAVGQPLVYEFTVGNIGAGQTGREIVVTDTLPAGITVNNGIAEAMQELGPNGSEWTCQSDAASPQTVTCKSTVNIHTGSGNDSTTFAFATDPVPASLDGTTLVNNATVTTTDSDTEANNDTATDSTLVTTTDITSPTVNVTGMPAVIDSTSPFTVTIDFNEDVTGFSLADLQLTNATASNLVTLDASTYTIDVTPDALGNIDIEVPANAAQDSAGNQSSASNFSTVVFNSNAVDLSILNAPAFVANEDPYTVDFQFSEDVIGFTAADVVVLNGTASSFTVIDGSTYSIVVTPDGTGDPVVDIAGGVATDTAGLDSNVAASATTVYNVSTPTVEVQGAPAGVNTLASFPVTFQFSEAVTEFIASDVAVTNATLSNFVAVDGDTYTADITPNGNGDIDIQVPVGVAIDVASNANQASVPVVVPYDVTGPQLSILGMPVRVNSTAVIPVTFEFDETVSGFDATDVVVNNATLSGFTAVDGNTFTANLTPTGAGDIAVSVAVAAAQDVVGNDSATAQAQTIYDDVPPVLGINTVALDNIINSVEDDTPVTISGTSIGLENTQSVNINLNGQNYVAPVSADTWTVSIPATDAQALGPLETITATATDLAGNPATPVTLDIQHDATAPAAPIVTAQLTNQLTPVISGTMASSAGDVLTVEVNGVVYTAGDGFLTDNGNGTWDLSVPPANSIAEGTYEVVATLTDAAGNSAVDASASELEIDTTPPATPLIALDLVTVDDSGVSATDDITLVTAPNFSLPAATVTPGAIVTLYSNGINSGTAPAAADGSFALGIAALGDATYAIRYTVTDSAGNESALSPTLNITVDTVTAAPVITTPIAVDGIVSASEQTAVSVAGTSEAGAEVDVTFSDGSNAPVVVTVTADSNGDWSLQGSEADLSSLDDGSLDVSASATDIAGNTNTSVIESITLDSTAPQVPAVTTLTTNDTTPIVTGTATTAVGDTLEVSLNGVVYPASGTHLTDNNDGTWSLAVPAANVLSQASYDVIVTVTDAAGNAAVDITSDELIIDVTPPATPVVQSQISASATPVIEGSAVIAAGEILNVTVGGTTYVAGDGHLQTNANDTWTLTIPVANSLADSTYEVGVSVTDAAGNIANDASANELIVDTTAPAVPTATAQITNNTTPVITGTAVVGTGETLSVIVDTVTYTAGDGSLVDNGDGTWTLTIPAATPIVEGNYDVIVVLTDAAGNSSTDASVAELIIDTTAPATPLLAPDLISANDSGSSDTDNITSVTAPEFTVPAGTGTAGEAVEVFANGSSIGVGVVAADGSFSIVSSAFVDGNYAITYQFTDVAGNQGLASPALNISIDSAAVIPQIDMPIEGDSIVNSTEDDDVLITGTSESGSSVLVSVTDGLNPAQQTTVVADSNGVWTLAGSELDLSSLNDGTLNVDATATDIAGNVAVAVQESITHQTVLPVVNIAAISGDDIINALEDDVDITLSGTTVDVEDGQLVTLSINGKDYTAAVTAGAWSTVLPALDAQVLGASATLTADVVNIAGNAATQATRIVVHDVDMPEITINPVAVDDVINALEDDADVAVSGTTTGVEDGQVVTVSINGNDYPGAVTANSWNVVLPAVDAQALPASTVISAAVSDLAGNDAATAMLTVVHDVVAPVVTVDSTPIATGANSSNYVVAGSCTAGDESVSVAITAATPASQPVPCNAAGEWFATFDVSAIADGVAVIVVDATQADLAGNTAAAATVQADKDTTVPSITIDVIAGDDYINAIEDDSVVVISGTTTDIEDGQIATIVLNSNPYNATVTSNAWSVNVPSVDATALNSSETVTADVANLAGTSAPQATRDIYHDTVAPAVPAVTSQITNLDTPVIEGTAVLNAGDVLTVSVGGQSYIAGQGDLVDNGDGTWTLTIPPANFLGDAIYDVDVTVTDAAGNSAAESTTNELEIDTSAPGTPVIAPDLVAADDSGISDTDDLTNVLTASFSVPAGTGTAGHNATLYADGVEIGAAVVAVDGSFNVATLLPGDGSHSITFTLTDQAGNESAPSLALPVDVDTTILSPTIDTPIELDNIISALEHGDVLVTGTAEAGASVSVTFDDGINPSVVAVVTADVSGNWTLLGNEVDLSTLAEGVIGIEAIASDDAGNSATSLPATIEHDSVPPATPVVNALTTNSGVPVIEGTATVAPGDTLSVSVNGISYVAGAGQLTDFGDGTWALQIPALDSLADGLYQVGASLVDQAGNSAMDATVNELQVDTTAPTAPTTNTLISAVGTPTLTGTVTLGPGESLQVSVNGVAYTTADALVVPGDGTWSLAIPVGDSLADGSYEIQAVVTDAALNSTADSTTNELVIDTLPPVVPTVTALVTNDTNPVIAGTATLQSGEILSVTVDGVTYTDGDGNLAYDPAGTWQLIIPAANAIADGSYQVEATVTDVATNASVDASSLELVVDTTPPVVPTVLSQSSGTPTPTISGTATLGAGDSLVVNVAGVDYPASGSDLTTNPDGSWTLIIPGPDSLAQTTYDVVVTVTDAAGNISIDSTSSELTVDLTQPSTPLVDAQVTNDTTPVITGAAILESGETLTVQVDGNSYAVGSGLTVTGGIWSLQIPAANVMVDGTYNVVASVSDPSGNTSADSSIDELLIDTVAPTISIQPIASDNVINALEDDSAVVVSGTTTDVEDGQMMTLLLGATSYQATVTANSWSVSVPAGDAQALADSTVVSAQVADAAGNPAVDATLVLLHDTQAPVVAVTVIPLINGANQSTYLVEGSCSTGEGDVSVSVDAGTPATQLVSCSAAGTWSATLDVSAAADGSDAVTVTVTQSDVAGNVSTPAIASADKDTTLPTIVISDAGDSGDAVYNQAESLSVQVSGSTIAVEDFQTVTVTFDDGVTQLTTTAALVNNIWVADAIDISALANGSITVSAVVSDLAGNTATPAVELITLDADAPVILASNYGPGADTTPPLSGTTDLPDGTIISVADAAGTPYCSATASTGSWSCDSTITLADGTFMLFATASDAAGNSASSAFDVVVNTQVDSDGDGISDLIEGGGDSDGDGTPDYLDSDSDNDGIDDVVESAIDTDGDGIPNYLDLDADNDSVSDSLEQNIDSDSDGIADFLDLDSDNDGVTDLAEAGVDTTLDTNSDGRLDGAVGNNGVLDTIETAIDSGLVDYTADGVADTPTDTDLDGIPDMLDLDSDNDGVADVTEAGGVELTGSATIDSFTDTNGDGLHDPLAFVPLADPDTDGDGIEDRLSLDSDADGLSDLLEAGGPDTDMNGLVDGLTDSNMNGLHDAYEAAPLPDTDTDADMIPNRVETDSDGDGISDNVESNGGNPYHDTDLDGIPDHIDLDSDADGLSDAAEGVADIDGDSIPDYIDNNALADTDGDGINDGIEGLIDTDGDGIPNLNDADSDGDGIDDVVEGNIDTDSDGVPDYLDLDSDADGIPDAIELATDFDGDGVANFLDQDSDADGINDSVEAGANPSAPVDSDLDGDVDFLDTDSDDDDIDDSVETQADSDGDGTPNYLDADSDGDGIPDAVELDGDPDSDGLGNQLDQDSDGDGIADSVESSADQDQDGLENFLDSDSDGDGIPDAVEGITDSDGDGIANFLDTDSDADGVPDQFETAVDTDNDGLPNFLDTDSDADGLADSLEAGPVADSPIDTDNDGTANYLSSDSDGDGIPDQVEGIDDADGDGLANYIDADSDGDGIPDLVEGVVDTDGDGAPDYLDLDSDADSVNDVVEAGLNPALPQDSDGDGVADYLDDDSDNDGVPDLTEGNIDSDGDGIADLIDTDSNGDGLPDLIAGPNDFDGDGIPDYLDSDIDGDGLSNISEGLQDTDGDGLSNYLDLDSDGDTIPDSVELNGDADGDEIGNYIETDADGDNIPDQVEAGANPLTPADSDGNGIPDYLDPDSDGDGIPDLIESSIDTDGDLVPDYLDLDADGDGIPDAVEGTLDTDADGVPNFVDIDSDGDGIGDELESNVDTDADQLPDYLDLDSDGDQILDSVEGSVDTDGDSGPDYIDPDADADGIPDVIETDADPDGDGLGNYIDLDSDGDGVSDFVEVGSNPSQPLDTDADGTPDFLDLDSDGDGILDVDEGVVDSDGDGEPDSRDADSNNDGIPDEIAGFTDFDGDGIPNFIDDDIDGDGIPNTAEGITDLDGDGLVNYLDGDSDGDGILDAVEGNQDSDGDSVADFVDTDSDGDAIPDSIEGVIDSDGDSVPDYIDTDSDNDLIPDRIETSMDSDLDGQPNYLDADSDNDGVLDFYETSDDTDGDNLPNHLDNDADGDGIVDSTEAGPAGSGYLTPPVDSDMDGVVDFLDADSDGDGIADAIETAVDSDSDGIPNYLDTDSDGDGIADMLEQDVDTDSDGLPDFIDPDSDADGIPDGLEGTNDTDGDGLANYIDVDADADGIPDLVETAVDTDADGIPDFMDTDSDSDGVSDVVEAGVDPANPVDTDSDALPDYIDTDSDNDGVADVDEGVDDLDGDGTPNLQDPDDNNDGIPDSMLGAGDTDGDGIADTLDNDIDGDGIDNSSEGLTDPDGDGIPNFLDPDSDGDGIDDAIEGTADQNGDSIPDYLDTDSDGDGIADVVEGNVDSDSDGIPDFKDLDSDGDAIPDSEEGNSDDDQDGIPNFLDLDSDGDTLPDSVEGLIDSDGDGISDYLDLDSDNDTINDVVEAGPTPGMPADTDLDGLADFRDVDSDGDGIPDFDEGITDSDGDGIPNASDLDSNNDGIPDADVGGGDLDGDGIPDFLDGDIDGDGLINAVDGTGDADNDGTPNYLDTDSDGDGIPDVDEQNIDSDNDGTPDFLDLDSDNDSISDEQENQFDSDGDGVPNYLDTDSDGDAIPDSVELAGDFGEDGTPDFLDTDADDDGISDVVEGVLDLDADGQPNYVDVDSDGDGIDDIVEGAIDSDFDGVANYADNDSDGDTIADSLETAADPDNDGIPNFVDTDSDGDGISDEIETAVDTDGDGLANFLDLDSDGDGIDDSLEGVADSDGDGIADYLDFDVAADADGDGISDAVEGTGDIDGDGIPNNLDLDSDGDGIADSVETAVDTDGDGTPDFLDGDSDADGVPDQTEGAADTDGDGVPNNVDSDADGDGILDVFEGAGDADGDGVPNSLDLDSDGDGIADAMETEADSDGDGVADYLDTDSDNDGISDAVEGSVDTDGDGVADFQDTDSDNDQLADSLESVADTDGDGTPDYLDTDADGDGIGDSVEGAIDSDGDGLSNSVDTDSDGDGIPDAVEGATDADGDGAANYIDSDADGDGVNDSVEAGIIPAFPVDSDGDSAPDFLDPDSDDDGITDGSGPGLDSDGDGIVDELDQDDNNDGIADADIGPGDTDGDGVADIVDSDIDGDGIPNTEESASDTDGDGVPDFMDIDSDNDGISDAVEGTGDTDGDGIADYLDTESDGDGIHDAVELGADPTNPMDSDGDGIPDFIDTDSDGDGISDAVEGVLDTDADGQPDYLDTDADGDGIPDEIEQNKDTDGDGAPDYIDVDADGDGISDLVESGPNPMAPVDTDGDAIVDYLDTDSDNDGSPDTAADVTDSDGDGIADVVDGDNNNDGIPDALLSPTADLDADGIPDSIDDDVDGDGIPNSAERLVDSDGDGISDFLDADADNDGISDRVEGTRDSDGDGIPDYRDTDSDGDGIDDSAEGSLDTDMDGIPNYLDPDLDGDGIPDATESTVDSDGDGLPDYIDTDADGDGVDDSIEGALDSDGDGTPNYLDVDSDNDGISDLIEGSVDSDGDGVADAIDVDADSDGIGDIVENTGDSDGDSIPDYLDIDSDNDNIPDAQEGDTDSDGDGTPDYIDSNADLDSDSDGIPDSVEGTVDTDNDGTPDFLDPDSDGDGIPDQQESTVDTDGDGVADYIDSDSDGDGIDDSLEGQQDTDGDGVPDYVDTDADGDGVDDQLEGQGDTDGDGVIDALDADSDNDGIPDVVEQGQDTDGDGIDNSRDLDSDNDGITDAQEFFGKDAGSDGIVDGFQDLNGDGIHDEFASAQPIALDSDGDGIADYLDIDSDNDGLPDVVEAEGNDADNDGRIDAFVDNNNNGLSDAVEANPQPIADLDNDLVPNYRDTDSDQDGLTDLLESRGEDQNSDGYVDSFRDLNGDGMDDSLLLGAFDVSDSDNDGIYDHLELDSDNDGVSDLLETGGVDIDNDGIVDTVGDRDNDGIPDAVDVDITGGPDADQDGIDDSADADFSDEPDQDRDGIVDSSDPDADGNGFADDPDTTLPLGAALPDTDGDDIPNFQEAETDAPIKTGINGTGAGCSVASGVERSFDPLLLLILLISSFAIARPRRRFNRARYGMMHPSDGGATIRCAISSKYSLGVVLMVLACLVFSRANAQAAEENFAEEDSDKFMKTPYIGIGAGISMLNPDTEGSRWEVSESNSTGFQVTLGMDFSRWLTAELHYASLGEAGLSEINNAADDETVSYQIAGLSALAYLSSKNEDEQILRRQGLAGYARIGVGFLSNSADDVEIELVNSAHLLLGIGAEYALENGLAVRGEYISFDGDVQYAQLALVYRIGEREEEEPAEPVTVIRPTPAPPKPEPPKPVIKPAPAPQVIGDDDADGVNNQLDRCPNTLRGLPVGVDGCELFRGVLNGVNFETGSAQLTVGARSVLDNVASQLLKFPAVRIQINAHTDNLGGKAFNLDLSRKRIVSVARYLGSKGISSSRLAGRAFGESKPIASNDTEEGRARNRRVEMIDIK